MHDPERLANGLTEDLQMARASAKVAYHMRHMVRAKSPLAHLAPEFVWLAMRNARDAAVIHLWKTVDTQPSARSIPWFVRNCSVLGAATQRTDLQHLSPHNPLVKRLGRLRHNVFAHRGGDSDTVHATDVILAHNITETEFLRLADDAADVLRRHLGRHLTMQVDVRDNRVVGELIDLDIHLEGSYRGRYGIERRIGSGDIE